MSEHTKMGPLLPSHPLCRDMMKCPACHRVFKKGEYVTLILVGPGDDEEAQEKARKGQAYDGVAVPVHYTCATGEKT